MQIGALWLKEKDGKKYFSGQIEYPGTKMNFAVFRNEKKTAENQPDYIIAWSPPKKNADGVSSEPGFDDTIPF